MTVHYVGAGTPVPGPALPSAVPPLPAPGAAKAVRKRLRKSLNAGRSPNITSMKALADQALQTLRENFHRRIDEQEMQSDEEIIAELSPYMEKTRGGRVKGVTEEVYEEKLLLAYRLHSRGQTAPQIARLMKVSEPMARQYLKDVRVRMRVNPEQLDLQTYVGEGLYVYKEVNQMALATMSKQGATDTTKLNAATLVLACQRQVEDFLTRLGIYSPVLLNQFQTLVFAQNHRFLGVQTADPHTDFMDGMAKALMALAANRRREPTLLEQPA